MPIRGLKSRFLQLRVSYLVISILCLITVIRIFMISFYNYKHISLENIPLELYKKVAPNLVLKKTKPDCTYEHVLQSKTSIYSWDVPKQYNNFSAAGISNGSFVPDHCNPLISVAILVTYRNRQSQLDIFLPYMHNFLRKQNIHYKIYLIEQQDNKPWNKGLLYNIGARHALLEKFPCLILHDVDVLPLNEGNLYACLQQPRHLSASLDKFRFVLPYAHLVGGALALRADHYQWLNGFSNRFYGWGGEDDDLAFKILSSGLQIQRFPPWLSEYTMLVHPQERKNNQRNRIIAENMRTIGDSRRRDGLDSVRYDDVRVVPQRLVTLVAVKL